MSAVGGTSVERMAADGMPAQTFPAQGLPAQGAATPDFQRRPGMLARWLRRRRAQRRRIDHAVWDLRERYGEAAAGIALASSRAPGGFMVRRFWRKVAIRLKRLG